MATRRRIGVRLATTEAARRQLMQPVACWEKTWVIPDNAPSSIKVYKWVKTDKKQQFSDDEEEADEPLAPLPDEPEVVEGDEDMDPDEPAPSAALAQEGTETNFANQETSEPQTKPSSPAPVLSLQQTEPTLTVDGGDMLDASFKALEGSINVDVHGNVGQADVGGLDMSVLGPDAPFDGLGQLDAANALLGGSLMGDAGDPFGPSIVEHLQEQEATGSSMS